MQNFDSFTHQLSLNYSTNCSITLLEFCDVLEGAVVEWEPKNFLTSFQIWFQEDRIWNDVREDFWHQKIFWFKFNYCTPSASQNHNRAMIASAVINEEKDALN